MYWVALVALGLATAVDLRRREIPDSLSVVLLLVAVTAKLSGWHPVSWTDILLGCGVAFVVSVAFFALGGMGGGDVKLLTALGSVLGFQALLPFLIATGLVGGIFAVVAWRRGHREIPYAPAMFLGLILLLPVFWIR